MGGTPQGSYLGREGRSRRTIRKVLLALFLFTFLFVAQKEMWPPEGSRAAGKDEKGCEQRNKKNGRRSESYPGFPWGCEAGARE